MLQVLSTMDMQHVWVSGIDVQYRLRLQIDLQFAASMAQVSWIP